MTANVKIMRQEIPDGEIKALILKKMVKHGYFGGRHTGIKSVSHGFEQQHLGKRGHKRIEWAVDELIKEGIVLKKPAKYASHGYHIRLNPAKQKEIEEYLRRHNML
ncbi:hypothetical protein HY546_03705 [archaeon]|nr:hypothetical protein [archaeon]